MTTSRPVYHHGIRVTWDLILHNPDAVHGRLRVNGGPADDERTKDGCPRCGTVPDLALPPGVWSIWCTHDGTGWQAAPDTHLTRAVAS